jgi:hypothetical protein
MKTQFWHLNGQQYFERYDSAGEELTTCRYQPEKNKFIHIIRHDRLTKTTIKSFMTIVGHNNQWFLRMFEDDNFHVQCSGNHSRVVRYVILLHLVIHTFREKTKRMVLSNWEKRVRKINQVLNACYVCKDLITLIHKFSA